MSKIIALILIVIFFPLVIIVAFLIKIKYPGPFFYTQIREGKDGKPFNIIKMRTMVLNANEVLREMLKNDPILADSWERTGVIKNDPRIAGKWGKLSRQLSIDELPQLVNVLRGEMGFIGPRPLEISSVESLGVNNRKLRHSVLPGLTGLSQVRNRKASFRQMQFYDKIYIKNKSICLDVFILYRTIFSVLNRTGA